MFEELNSRIEKAVSHLSQEYNKLQLGRANPGMVEDLQVESYGALQPLKNTASVNVMDSQTLSIQPWDKTILHAIAKAITDSGLGLNPQLNGESVMIKVPPLTEERRKEVSKYAKTLMEDAKVAVRNARGDELKKIKKQEADKEISEDERKDLEQDVQKIIDEGNKKIEETYKKKEEDIMKV
ncbi:MAG: ribosome recycling factor [Candidatus Gracilibacteria bacterium]|nr:ribosome recycling factor [Candidatus Gracilibacteria bacterium]